MISRLYLPVLSPALNYIFVKVFSINMGEAEFPKSHYKTIEDIFTRTLKVGSREIGVEPVSPADGKLSKSAEAKNGMAVQAKDNTHYLNLFMPIN